MYIYIYTCMIPPGRASRRLGFSDSGVCLAEHKRLYCLCCQIRVLIIPTIELACEMHTTFKSRHCVYVSQVGIC